MNSEVTLVPPPSSTSLAVKGQVRLVFKRNDPHHAVLLEDDVPRYFLATSDGMNKVTVRDATQRMVADVNRRMFLNDVFSFGGRGFSKAVKVADVLQSAPSTSDGRSSMALHTEEGTYYWRKRGAHHWALYEDARSAPVAWTETVAGPAPTWALVLEDRDLSVFDYALASLFYLKAARDTTEVEEDQWERVDHRVAYLSAK